MWRTEPRRATCSWSARSGACTSRTARIAQARGCSATPGSADYPDPLTFLGLPLPGSRPELHATTTMRSTTRRVAGGHAQRRCRQQRSPPTSRPSGYSNERCRGHSRLLLPEPAPAASLRAGLAGQRHGPASFARPARWRRPEPLSDVALPAVAAARRGADAAGHRDAGVRAAARGAGRSLRLGKELDAGSARDASSAATTSTSRCPLQYLRYLGQLLRGRPGSLVPLSATRSVNELIADGLCRWIWRSAGSRCCWPA